MQSVQDVNSNRVFQLRSSSHQVRALEANRTHRTKRLDLMTVPQTVPRAIGIVPSGTQGKSDTYSSYGSVARCFKERPVEWSDGWEVGRYEILIL